MGPPPWCVRYVLTAVHKYTTLTETVGYRFRYGPDVRAGDEHRCRESIGNRQRAARQAVQHLFGQVNHFSEKSSNGADVVQFCRPKMVMLNELWAPRMLLRRLSG